MTNCCLAGSFVTAHCRGGYQPPATLWFLSGWLNGKMLLICTNSPEPALFCRVVLPGRLIASPTKAFAETCPKNINLYHILDMYPRKKSPEVLLDFPGNFPYFIKSAMVTLSRYSLTRRFSSLHMGRVRQSAVRTHFSALHSKQATGAKSPSVSRRISPMG